MSEWRPFAPWDWDIPVRFNIGVACTDRHLGTPVAGRVAMIIDDDEHGPALTCELASNTEPFWQGEGLVSCRVTGSRRLPEFGSCTRPPFWGE